MPKMFSYYVYNIKDYEVIRDNIITDKGLIDFCLFAKCDQISYEGATSDESRIQAINEEIQSIEKKHWT